MAPKSGSGPEVGSGAGFAVDRGPERVDVERAVVPPPVDEERRGSGGAAVVGALDVARDAAGAGVLARMQLEAVAVESQLLGVAHEVGGGERVLVLEQQLAQCLERGFPVGRLGLGLAVPLVAQFGDSPLVFLALAIDGQPRGTTPEPKPP